MRFFVGVDAICRCDFLGKKGCDAILITIRCDCHPCFRILPKKVFENQKQLL